jgi:thiol-disulfide isomerase/thioredoxin
MFRNDNYVQFYVNDIRKKFMRNIIDNRWNIVTIISALVISIIIFFILKKHYILPNFLKGKMLNPNQEFIPSEKIYDDRATVLFFYATWCPHSKKAMPEWKRFRQRTFGDPLRYNKIEFEEIDCNNDDNDTLLKIYNIDSFPAVRLKANGKTYIYEGKVTETTLTSFLEKFVPILSKQNNTKESLSIDSI